MRAYGAREIATGVSILVSHDPTPWVWGRIGGDVLDIGLLARADPRSFAQKTNLALASTAVVGVTVLDMMCAVGLSDEKRIARSGAFDYADRSGFPRASGLMRGAASDFENPFDFQIPKLLRPWSSDQAATATSHGDCRRV